MIASLHLLNIFAGSALINWLTGLYAKEVWNFWKAFFPSVKGGEFHKPHLLAAEAPPPHRNKYIKWTPSGSFDCTYLIAPPSCITIMLAKQPNALSYVHQTTASIRACYSSLLSNLVPSVRCAKPQQVFMSVVPQKLQILDQPCT